MPGPTYLRGEHVTLNTIEQEDAAFLQRAINDPDVWATLLDIEPINGDQERQWIEGLGDRDGVHLLICADGEPVGVIGMDPPLVDWGTAEIGYFIAPEHWGQGYATAAVDLVAGYAFDQRRLNTLHADILATNPASGRVLEKVGFEREGVRREAAFVDGAYVDIHNYGLLASDWRARKAAADD